MSQLLRFDPSAAFLPETGLELTEVASLGPALEKLRDEMCEIDVKMLSGEIATPASKQPLDAGFYLMPERLLAEYEANRAASELGRILSVTKQLMTAVDRVVVLGSSGFKLGAQAVMDACCQPYFNELSRGERGSRPRIYFAGNNADNDASQGLLHLLGAHRGHIASGVDDSWGIVVISEQGGALEAAAAFRLFLKALEVNCGGDMAKLRSRVIPVAGDGSALHGLATELGCREFFELPAGVGRIFSVLSVAGIIPAALMGINVMKLLEGAKTMNELFRTAKAADSIVLQYAAVNHLLESKRGATVRLLSVGSQGLESAVRWYDHILVESVGKHLKAATPLTIANAGDPNSRQQQPQAWRRDKCVHNVIVENYRFDPLRIERRASDVDGLNDIADKTLLDVTAAAIEAANRALRADGRPSTNLFMSRVDEYNLGQFFQMLMLATVIEGRLLGINPYGRPAIEAFRINMNRSLGRQF